MDIHTLKSGFSQGHISNLETDINQLTIETLQRLLAPMGISLSEFFNEDVEISVLNDCVKEFVLSFRTIPDEKADLFLQLGKALNQK